MNRAASFILSKVELKRNNTAELRHGFLLLNGVSWKVKLLRVVTPWGKSPESNHIPSHLDIYIYTNS